MKRIYNSRGTKQLIDSGWKEFDKQTNLITRGNAFCNTQYSLYIRPWSELSCNGINFKEGYLTEQDLKPFKQFNIPNSIKKILYDKERRNSVILYMFFICNKNNNMKIEPFGWVVANGNHEVIERMVVCGYRKNLSKRISALNTIIDYIRCE